MADVVVTLPKVFEWGGLKGIAAWCSEGDAAGEPETGEFYCWSLGWQRPNIQPGERVYVVHAELLRGWAPLVELYREPHNDRYGLIRSGGAVACTIRECIPGFRGFRYRWWDRAREVPFVRWRETEVAQGKFEFGSKFPTAQPRVRPESRSVKSG